jgi:hypothetical protein
VTMFVLLLECRRVKAGKPRRPKGPAQRQRVGFGIWFVALGALQLLLIDGPGSHVLNLVAAIGFLAVGCLHLTRACVQAHRKRATQDGKEVVGRQGLVGP